MGEGALDEDRCLGDLGGDLTIGFGGYSKLCKNTVRGGDEDLVNNWGSNVGFFPAGGSMTT